MSSSTPSADALRMDAQGMCLNYNSYFTTDQYPVFEADGLRVLGGDMPKQHVPPRLYCP